MKIPKGLKRKPSKHGWMLREVSEIAKVNGFDKSQEWWEEQCRAGIVKSTKANYKGLKSCHWVSMKEIKRIISLRPVLSRTVIMLLLSMILSGGALAQNVPMKMNWKMITIHHTATIDGNQYTIDQCNADHKARGWDGCGYNFLIEPHGLIVTARGLERVGAHVGGYNTGNLGIAIVGTGKANIDQIKSLKKLIDVITKKFGEIPIYPHRHFKSTECPGDEIWSQVKLLWPIRSAS